MKTKRKKSKCDLCSGKHYARGYCQKHYVRLLRHGDPNHFILNRCESKIGRVENMIATITESGCWIWMGRVKENGYGILSFKNKVHHAHRFSYEAYIGAVPDGLCVLHKCDVRCCVNPDHLFVGTHQDNMDDMVSKKRHNHKVTEDMVGSLMVGRERYGKTYQELADEHGVSNSTVCKVINAKKIKAKEAQR